MQILLDEYHAYLFTLFDITCFIQNKFNLYWNLTGINKNIKKSHSPVGAVFNCLYVYSKMLIILIPIRKKKKLLIKFNFKPLNLNLPEVWIFLSSNASSSDVRKSNRSSNRKFRSNHHICLWPSSRGAWLGNQCYSSVKGISPSAFIHCMHKCELLPLPGAVQHYPQHYCSGLQHQHVQ